MYDIITFGSATQDILIKPKKLTSLKYSKESEITNEVCFPMGSKIDVEEMYFYSGGGGTNTAATFALQGFKTSFCGMVGDDIAGQKITNGLKQLKIDAKLVLKTKEKPTNHSIIIFGNNNDRTIFAYRGAAELMNKNNIPWRKLEAKWFYLAPLTGLLCDSFEELVEFAKKNDIKVAANPSMAQISLQNFGAIAKRIDILILNQEEASFLAKMPFEKEREIFDKIDEMCPGIAVMTKGGEGAVVSNGKSVYFAKPHAERKIVDTTGAGDAFGSGFVAEFIKSQDIEKSIQFGMANSAGCLSEVGAQNGLLEKDRLFEKVKVVRK